MSASKPLREGRSGERATPRMMAITDRRGLGPRSFAGWLRSLPPFGVDAVQVREKDLPDRELFALVREAREVLPAQVAVLVNGRLDIALAAGADGVHLPSAGLPAGPLRRWGEEVAGGRGILVGRSTHSAAEVEEAARQDADYATFGPLFPTPSKERYGPPPGLAGLRRAARTGLPLIALGGIDAEGAAEVLAAGAAGIAGIRVFQDPAALRRLAEVLSAPRPGRPVW